MQPGLQALDLERKRADLLQKAAELVQNAMASGRELTAEEDLRVLELTKDARAIEEELLRFKRHHDIEKVLKNAD